MCHVNTLIFIFSKIDYFLLLFIFTLANSHGIRYHVSGSLKTHVSQLAQL